MRVHYLPRNSENKAQLNFKENRNEKNYQS